MTHEQLIADARNLQPDFDALLTDEYAIVKAALEVINGHGCADEQAGDVEAPCGFFYRIDRWIVVVDEQGFVSVDEHANATYAREHFDALNREYTGSIDA